MPYKPLLGQGARGAAQDSDSRVKTQIYNDGSDFQSGSWGNNSRLFALNSILKMRIFTSSCLKRIRKVWEKFERTFQTLDPFLFSSYVDECLCIK